MNESLILEMHILRHFGRLIVVRLCIQSISKDVEQGGVLCARSGSVALSEIIDTLPYGLLTIKEMVRLYAGCKRNSISD